MNHLKTFALAGITAVLSPAAASAAEFDGKTNLLCAIGITQTCNDTGNCYISDAEGVDLPAFMEIEFDDKTLSDTVDNSDERVTKFEKVLLNDDNELVLQGDENYAWSLVVNRSTGKMTMTAAGDSVGFVAFGSCIEED